MRKLLLVCSVMLALVIAGLSLAQAPATPKASTTPAPKSRAIKRTPDGRPDLQGMYDLATLTPLERAAGAKAVLTAEEAAALEKRVAAQKAVGDLPSKGDRDAPP